MDKMFEVIAAITGTTMTTVALYHLIPEGLWLYLLMLVMGTQFMLMAVRSALR